MLKQMWEKLDAYTVSAADGSERNINVRNEWGGFSRRLKMPVFTGWQDHARSVNGQMRVLVSDRRWNNTAGVNNQEHWVPTPWNTTAKRPSSSSRRWIR